MKIRVIINWDDEAAVWVAICDAIGLAMESASYDALLERIKIAIPELLELNNYKKADVIISTEDRIVCA